MELLLMLWPITDSSGNSNNQLDLTLTDGAVSVPVIAALRNACGYFPPLFTQLNSPVEASRHDRSLRKTGLDGYRHRYENPTQISTETNGKTDDLLD